MIVRLEQQSSGTGFDLPVEQLHAKHFNHYPVTMVSGTTDGLVASMGCFSMYAVAAGMVEQVDNDRKITVNRVAFFVRDNFDYEKQEQRLGWWDCEELEHDFVEGTAAFNEDFRAFRESHGAGGDFYVYALPEKVEGWESISYEI